MKKFFKIFFAAILIFGLIAGGVILFIDKSQHEARGKNTEINEKWYEDTLKKISENQEKALIEKMYAKDPLMLAIKKSNRINVLVMGLEKDPRTDVIIFASCDPDNQSVDLISVPRDTYLYEAGYKNPGHKKINSYYGKKGEDGKLRREKGTVQAVSEILKVPIHHYVSVSYTGVEEIINAIGGVTVQVPFHFKYDDPTDKPPLHIDIPKGTQHLDGKNTVHFLRYRHGNPKPGGGYQGGYPEGDLGRIKAQQKVIKEVIKKSISLNLPKVVEKSMKAVKTDMTGTEMIAYATMFMNFDMENLHMSTLPGHDEMREKLSFYIADEEAIKAEIQKMYGVDTSAKEGEQAEEKSATKDAKKQTKKE